MCRPRGSPEIFAFVLFRNQTLAKALADLAALLFENWWQPSSGNGLREPPLPPPAHGCKQLGSARRRRAFERRSHEWLPAAPPFGVKASPAPCQLCLKHQQAGRCLIFFCISMQMRRAAGSCSRSLCCQSSQLRAQQRQAKQVTRPYHQRGLDGACKVLPAMLHARPAHGSACTLTLASLIRRPADLFKSCSQSELSNKKWIECSGSKYSSRCYGTD